MGTDINIIVEQEIDGEWQVVDCPDDIWDDRNYSAFGWVNDVRNYAAVEPRFADRGPSKTLDKKDLEQLKYECWGGVEAEYPSTHFTVKELLEVNYNEVVENRRCMIDGNGGVTCAPGEGKKMRLYEFLGWGWMSDMLALAAMGDPAKTKVTVYYDS
jgi:hypothetical protein